MAFSPTHAAAEGLRPLDLDGSLGSMPSMSSPLRPRSRKARRSPLGSPEARPPSSGVRAAWHDPATPTGEDRESPSRSGGDAGGDAAGPGMKRCTSVVGMDDNDPSRNPVRNTLFWRGATRHGVDPRLIRTGSPGPSKAPSLTLVKKRITGGGWGASTASRGLEGAPTHKPKPRRRRKVRRKKGKKGKATKAASSPGKAKTTARVKGLGINVAVMKGYMPTASPVTGRSKKVMISSGARSPPQSWTGGWYSTGRSESPSPGAYDPPTFLESARHRKAVPTSGTFGSNNRGNPRDPGCFIPFNDWSPSPDTYMPDDAVTRHNPGVPKLVRKMSEGVALAESKAASSPGPCYFPNPNSPTTQFLSSPSFSFGGGESRTGGAPLILNSARSKSTHSLLSVRSRRSMTTGRSFPTLPPRSSRRTARSGSPSPQPQLSPQTVQRKRAARHSGCRRVSEGGEEAAEEAYGRVTPDTSRRDGVGSPVPMRPQPAVFTFEGV